jgi:hypothetical protein
MSNRVVLALVTGAALSLAGCSDPVAQSKTDAAIANLQGRVRALEQQVRPQPEEPAFTLDVTWFAPGEPTKSTRIGFPNKAACDDARAGTLAEQGRLQAEADQKAAAARQSGWIINPIVPTVAAVCQARVVVGP